MFELIFHTHIYICMYALKEGILFFFYYYYYYCYVKHKLIK